MIVKETTNLDDIKAVLCNPAIYDTIIDDNCPLVEDFEPPIDDDHLYVGGYVKGEIIALMVYHKYLDGNECHVQVLPEYRKNTRLNSENNPFYFGELYHFTQRYQIYIKTF